MSEIAQTDSQHDVHYSRLDQIRRKSESLIADIFTAQAKLNRNAIFQNEEYLTTFVRLGGTKRSSLLGAYTDLEVRHSIDNTQTEGRYQVIYHECYDQPDGAIELNTTTYVFHEDNDLLVAHLVTAGEEMHWRPDRHEEYDLQLDLGLALFAVDPDLAEAA